MRIRSRELAQPKPALPRPMPGAGCPVPGRLLGLLPSLRPPARAGCKFSVGAEDSCSLVVVFRKSSAGLGFAPTRRKGSWMCFRGPSPRRAAYVGVRPLVPGLLRGAPCCELGCSRARAELVEHLPSCRP